DEVKKALGASGESAGLTRDGGNTTTGVRVDSTTLVQDPGTKHITGKEIGGERHFLFLGVRGDAGKLAFMGGSPVVVEDGPVGGPGPGPGGNPPPLYKGAASLIAPILQSHNNKVAVMSPTAAP